MFLRPGVSQVPYLRGLLLAVRRFRHDGLDRRTGAGDNPERLPSGAPFAALCGVSPVEKSSGKSQRPRSNGGGDRQANAALHQSPLQVQAHNVKRPSRPHSGAATLKKLTARA
jgi:transposase